MVGGGGDSHPSGALQLGPITLIWPCLGLFPFVSTFPSSRFLTTLLILRLYLLLLASSLLFPCARYPVWDTHPVHGIPVTLVFRGEIVLMAEALLPIDGLGRSQKFKISYIREVITECMGSPVPYYRIVFSASTFCIVL